MKKLAFITWDMSDYGGINQVINTLTKMFKKKYDIHVISLISKVRDCAYELDVDYYVVEYGDKRARNVICSGTTKLRRYLKKHNIDIILLMGFQVAAPVLVMTIGLKKKKIMCDHEALMSRWNEKKIRYVRYFSGMLSDKIVVLTKQTRDAYVNKFRFNQEKVTFIYNNIDEKIWDYVNDYDDNSKIILSAGRFSVEKGYSLLVEVASKVLKKNSDWKWYIYGDGEEYSVIAKKISEMKLDKQIILKGKVSNLYELYRQGAMFVLTSYREGLPLVLLEAMANHLPCVSFDIISGPNEIIHDGYDGYLIEPFNVEKMALKINKLIENRELRKLFSSRTKENLGRFDSKTILGKWCQFLDSI